MVIRKRGVVGVILVLFILLLSCSAFALKTTPLDQDLGELHVGRQFQQIFSVQNDGARPQKVALDFAPFSQYFSSYAQITPREFVLEPGKTQNVQLVVTIPESFGPEEHSLDIIDTLSGEDIFGLQFSLPGVPVEDLRLTDVIVEDVPRGQVVPITIKLENFGNVIAYAQPQIFVEQEGKEVGVVDYESVLQVLPGEDYGITLTYADDLPENLYDLRVLFDYNELYSTNELVRQFSVLGEQTFERTVHLGQDLTLDLSDFSLDSASYSYTLLQDDEVVAQGANQSYVDTFILPADEISRPGVYALRLVLNPEVENRVIDIRVEVLDRSYAQYIIYGIVLLCLILIGYFLNLHHLFQLVALRHEIRKERIKMQLMERRVNKLVAKTHTLVDSMRLDL